MSCEPTVNPADPCTSVAVHCGGAGDDTVCAAGRQCLAQDNWIPMLFCAAFRPYPTSVVFYHNTETSPTWCKVTSIRCTISQSFHVGPWRHLNFFVALVTRIAKYLLWPSTVNFQLSPRSESMRESCTLTPQPQSHIRDEY